MKHRLRFDVFSITGIIFIFAGGGLFAVGLWMALNFDQVLAHGEGDVGMMPPLFLLMGGVCLALGIGLVFAWAVKAKRQGDVIKNGVYAWGKVTGIGQDASQRINGWPTVFVIVEAEVNGSVRQFEGTRVSRHEALPEIGSEARVYHDSEFKIYAVTDRDGNLL